MVWRDYFYSFDIHIIHEISPFQGFLLLEAKEIERWIHKREQWKCVVSGLYEMMYIGGLWKIWEVNDNNWIHRRTWDFRSYPLITSLSQIMTFRVIEKSIPCLFHHITESWSEYWVYFLVFTSYFHSIMWKFYKGHNEKKFFFK